MTLRPQIIRADTLDLQDHEAPSAGDHSHQPEHPAPLGSGPAAPHQEDALRHLNQERNAEQEHLADAWGSGRSSHEGSDLLDEDITDPIEETRLDEAAIQQNGGDGEGEESLDDDIMDDRSSSPSIPDEDIDYQFVYALHNFVATVEGQANATKGDHMVLLDDTNSYWWLVRVVKDSSIGYLPAEHIETPNERLARFHKHRNMQVHTQSQLEDVQQPKSKNPLKKAMRRRNAKSVQFAAPTFYEPSEADWSDEGESDQEGEPQAAEVGELQNGDQTEPEEVNTGETLQTNGQAPEQAEDSDEIEVVKPVASEATRTAIDDSRPEQESLEQQQERVPRQSRNGTMRNTDSFFKDDTAEPRKISLTPNILREESAESSARSSADKAPLAPEVFEQIENSNTTTVEKLKEDKKKKEKKSGMLSGLFKRKDKKIKVDEAAGGTVVKQETESGSPILVTPADTGSPTGELASSGNTSRVPQATKRPGSSGKLTKAPPAAQNRQPNGALKSPTDIMQSIQPAADQQHTVNPTEVSGLTYASGGTSADEVSSSRQLNNDTPTEVPTSRSQPSDFQPTSLGSSRNGQNREKLQPTTQRMDIDGDSSSDERPTTKEVPATGFSQSNNGNSRDLAASPVNSSEESITNRPDLTLDTNSKQYRSASPPTPFDNTDSADHTAEGQPAASMDSTRSAATAAESVSTPTASSSPISAATPPAADSADPSWSDAALRSYVTERGDTDMRDMLIRVHDTTGVTPFPLDHPKMLGFGFHESQKHLDEMSSQLDGLLNGFLARSAARPKTQRK